MGANYRTEGHNFQSFCCQNSSRRAVEELPKEQRAKLSCSCRNPGFRQSTSWPKATGLTFGHTNSTFFLKIFLFVILRKKCQNFVQNSCQNWKTFQADSVHGCGLLWVLFFCRHFASLHWLLIALIRLESFTVHDNTLPPLEWWSVSVTTSQCAN